MFPKSIRWRLPLSYVAIALVAAVALGAVLLTGLSGYYEQREVDYLKSNGATIASSVSLLLNADTPADALGSQLEAFAFLSQARVRILDLDNGIIADSGDPGELNEVTTISFGLEAGGVSQAFTQRLGVDGEAGYVSAIAFGNAGADTGQVGVSVTESVVVKGGPQSDADDGAVSRVPSIGTQFGLGLGPEFLASGGRSSRVVRIPVNDDFGRVSGYVELSDGPAIGADILKSVALGWAMSSAVAVVVAAALGWLMSRGITSPLTALNAATSRMAGGDLSTRADISRRDELGTLGRSFNEMAGGVESTVATLQRFVADAAHQLHTPLTALRTNLELAPVTDGSPLEHARQEVTRMEALSAGLLDLSRIETAGVDAERGPIDISELLREMWEPYASQAEQARIALSNDLGSDDAVVLASGSHLRQAIGNLIDNALKFTGENGEVAVTMRTEADEAVLCVEDSGIGIPDDDLPHIFDRFHRGRNTAAHDGSGLGLAIAYAIINAHGGRITAENAEYGARLYIRLPLVR
jgi:signal transduction histidine kinase